MKRYLTVIFSVLVIIFLISPLNLQADKGKCDGDMKGEGMVIGKGHHKWELLKDIDENILKKMQEMRLKNQEEMLDLKTQIERKELEMEKVLINDEIDFNKVLSIHDEISDLRQKISRKMIEHKIEMYKLLPDDKKEIARKMFLHGFSDRKHGKEGMHNCKGGPDPFMEK